MKKIMAVIITAIAMLCSFTGCTTSKNQQVQLVANNICAIANEAIRVHNIRNYESLTVYIDPIINSDEDESFMDVAITINVIGCQCAEYTAQDIYDAIMTYYDKTPIEIDTIGIKSMYMTYMGKVVVSTSGTEIDYTQSL